MLKKVLSVLLACTLIAALSVSAMAAGDVKIKQQTGIGEEKTAYVIPNVSGKTNYPVSVEGIYVDTLPGYSVSAGTKITDLGGKYWNAWLLKEQNGKLVVNTNVDELNSRITKVGQFVQTEAGYWVAEKGASVQFNKAGTYLFVANYPTPMSNEPQFVILVVGGSAASADKSTTTTKATDKTSTTTKPADKNTVKVAGENRTPGEIQKHSSGGYLYTVKSGDTLYDITKRYYGNGNLWKELQKANQKWLDETKNGIIFVGYNLLLPAELGDVRVKV